MRVAENYVPHARMRSGKIWSHSDSSGGKKRDMAEGLGYGDALGRHGAAYRAAHALVVAAADLQ